MCLLYFNFLGKSELQGRSTAMVGKLARYTVCILSYRFFFIYFYIFCDASNKRFCRDIPGLPDTAFIEISSPPEFSPKVLNALKTDPINVDVRLLSSVYFKLAERWLSLLDDPELLKILVEVSFIHGGTHSIINS